MDLNKYKIYLRYSKGQQTLKTLLSLIRHQENANQTHNKTPLHSHRVTVTEANKLTRMERN
jgi:hypothetical protein